MQLMQRHTRAMAALILLVAGWQSGFDAPLSATGSMVFTASTCARGSDIFPGDGAFDGVFSGGPCSLFAPPASVQQYSEERVAAEFPLQGRGLWDWPHPKPLPVFTGVTLVLTPASGPAGNLGLAADEAVELWLYPGNGAITVNDLHTSGKVLGALLAGPTADGAVAVPLSPKALALVLAAAPHWTPPSVGVLLKGHRGASSVTMSFAGTNATTAFALRPKLLTTF